MDEKGKSETILVDTSRIKEEEKTPPTVDESDEIQLGSAEASSDMELTFDIQKPNKKMKPKKRKSSFVGLVLSPFTSQESPSTDTTRKDELSEFEEGKTSWGNERPSISALVFADEVIDYNEEMENTENFLLAETNIVPRSLLERDNSLQSFTYDSAGDQSTSSFEKHTISLEEFLSACQIHFRIFNQVPQKFSIDFDTNRRNSTANFFLSETEVLEKYLEKELFLKQSVHLLEKKNQQMKEEIGEIKSKISNLVYELNFENPSCFHEVQGNPQLCSFLKTMKKVAVTRSKQLWFEKQQEYFSLRYQNHLKALENNVRSVLHQIESLFIEKNEKLKPKKRLSSFGHSQSIVIRQIQVYEQELLIEDLIFQFEILHSLLSWNISTHSDSKLTILFPLVSEKLEIIQPSSFNSSRMLRIQLHPLSNPLSFSPIQKVQQCFIKQLVEQKGYFQKGCPKDQLPPIIDELTFLFGRIEVLSKFLLKIQEIRPGSIHILFQNGIQEGKNNLPLNSLLFSICFCNTLSFKNIEEFTIHFKSKWERDTMEWLIIPSSQGEECEPLTQFVKSYLSEQFSFFEMNKLLVLAKEFYL